jgi:hypothetical protein
MPYSCATCRHARTRAIPVLESNSWSADALKVRLTWDEAWQRRHDAETDRVQAREPFDYEPYWYAWCALYTRHARRNRHDIGVDRRRATVTHYQLCAYTNPLANCLRHSDPASAERRARERRGRRRAAFDSRAEQTGRPEQGRHGD